MQASSRFRWFDTLLLAGAAFFSLAAVAAIALAPKDNSSGVAVIFAPWTNAAETMTRSVQTGVRFVRFGAFDFIAVVETGGANHARILSESGAWLLADPAALAACLKPFKLSKI